MSQTLYEKFSTVLKALPDDEMIGALDVAESFIGGACRNYKADTVLSLVETERSADRLLRVLDGHTVSEAAAVMMQLRGELADELARRGASADDVREMREGGPRVGGPDEAA